MKSSNPSFSPIRRTLLAATVVLATGSLAAFAQSTSTEGSSAGSNSSRNDTYNSSSSNNGSSMNSNASDSSMSSNANDRSDANSAMASNDSSNSNDKLSWGDRRFVKKAAEGGQSEVALGQLAQEKASNPDVKSFGQQLVQDHTQANSQLMQIAQEKNLKLDEDKSKEDHEYKRLSKATGNDFDRQFVEHEVKDHEKDIKEFEKAAKDSKDAQVREFASQVLPKLREHLATAQRLQQSIVPTGRTDANSWRSDAGNPNSGTSSNSSSTGSSASMNSSTGSSDSSSGASSGAATSSTSSTR